MKKSIILNLVSNGNYIDNISMYGNKKYHDYSEELYELAEKLCENMSADERGETLEKITCTHAALEALTADKHFVEGFKLGLKIAAECFME